MSEIIYPAGCRSVTEDLDADELIRRLKTLARTLQAMKQDEEIYQQYIPLALHLAKEHFLMHQNKNVQLLIACCIADVLRIYAPEAPYEDAEQIKTIFQFFIKQLAGLKDPKDLAFKRYSYLLENLAYVKSFNICFELEDYQEIFCALFFLMFKIVNDKHSSEVKSFMLEILCPLIIESDVISYELLDIILINVVEPNKTQKKNAYSLAKELVIKCNDTLEPYIQAFFQNVLIKSKEEKNLQICKKMYDLIYELNHICPSVLLPVLSQLECKLKSSSETERLSVVALLARMFSEKGSQLAVQQKQLWRTFLRRFTDISVSIRIKCVQYSMHFLLNHPELRKDITDILKLRQHDADESVRYKVVTTIVATAKQDFEVISDSEDLLEFVKERTLDKKFKIRKEAISGLAMIYEKHLNDANVPQAIKKTVNWIKNKILHGYYMTDIEDRLLVERLLNKYLVPYQLPVEERMKKLYHLLGTIDDYAIKAFVELQKRQLVMRKAVVKWITIVKKPDAAKNELMIRQISHFLPDSVKAQEFLQRFSSHMRKEPKLLQEMEKIVQPNVSCKECADTIIKVLKRLEQSVTTNLYYNTIKILLERISSIMIDEEAIRVLIGYVLDCLKSGNIIKEIGLNSNNAGEKGLRLLEMLSFLFGLHFLHNDILMQLVNLFELKDEMMAPLVLSIFTLLGKYKPLCDVAPDIMNFMTLICKNFAATGTPKQAKHAVRCLFVNMTNNHDTIFPEIIERIKNTLTPTSEYYRTSIVTLGHIAYNLPHKYQVQIKNMVSRKIVKELLLKESSEQETIKFYERDWCRKDQLPEETRCKLEGLKCMTRWLLGLKTDVLSAQKIFKILNAFVINKGDLLLQGHLSKSEMSWLRLQAGCSMLKICEQKGVSDQFTAEQFYNLSQLMVDEVFQVREIFGIKLHRGLGRGIPNKCLPLDFMGYFALGGKEQNKELKYMLKIYMQININKRRDYVKTLSLLSLDTVERAMDQLPYILPDYMLVFAVSILAHDPEFTSHLMVSQLKVIKQCLWFILEPLITKSEYYCYGFYKNLVERMKNHKDALKPEDNEMNYKLWAVCDLAMNVIYTKTTNFDMKEFPIDTRIPTMYFKRTDETMSNIKNYLPLELQINMTTLKRKKFHNTHMANERPRRKTKSKQQKKVDLMKHAERK